MTSRGNSRPSQMRTSTSYMRTVRPCRISQTSDWLCPVRRASWCWLMPPRTSPRYTVATSCAARAALISGGSNRAGSSGGSGGPPCLPDLS